MPPPPRTPLLGTLPPGLAFWRLSLPSALAAASLLAIFAPIVGHAANVWRFSSPAAATFLAILVLADTIAADVWRFASSRPPRQQPSGGLCKLRPRQRQSTSGFRSRTRRPSGGSPLAALVLATAPATAACASDCGSRTQKEAAWGRRRPLGRGTCAWGTLC